MPIQYLKGDVTKVRENFPEGKIVIPHVLSETGAFNAGVAGCIRNKWPKAYDHWHLYLQMWHLTEGFDIHPWGETNVCLVEKDLYIANMCAQIGLRSNKNTKALSYAFLEMCLDDLKDWTWENSGFRWISQSYSIHMPRIGCGLAGGKWDKVEPIIQKCLGEYDVYVYDLA